MLKRTVLWCCASMAALGWLAVPAVAAPASGPPTLTAEHFAVTGGPTSLTCTLDGGTGSFSFTTSGVASGPYAGTFEETVTGTVYRGTVTVPETLTDFAATFTITAPDGSKSVTGSMALGPGSVTPCQQVIGTTTLTATSVLATYTATISTPSGSYRDQGNGTGSLWTSSVGGTSLDESFSSVLSKPKRTNK